MARFYIALIILVVFFLLIEIYAFQAFKVLSKDRFYRWVWIVISALIYVPFFIVLFTYSRANGQTPSFQYAFSLLLVFLFVNPLFFLVIHCLILIQVVTKILFQIPILNRRFYSKWAFSRSDCKLIIEVWIDKCAKSVKCDLPIHPLCFNSHRITLSNYYKFVKNHLYL